MSGYSVTNYNPYNVNNNFAFKGATDTTSQIKNVPQLTQQPDTVSFSTKNKKESLSNGAKWGLGALALAGVATLAYVLSKGKVGSKQTQQIVEQVEFKPAKTIEEAKKFAQEKLGVTYLDENCEFNDINMLNFINKWLSQCYNNPKVGHKLIPKIVYNNPQHGAAMSMSARIKVDGQDYGHALGINLEYFNNFEKEVLEKGIRSKGYKLSFYDIGNDGKYIIAEPKFDNEYTRRLAGYLNSDKLDFKDKMQCFLDLKSYIDRVVVDGKMQIYARKAENYLNHELGHLLHQETCKNYSKMGKVSEYLGRNEKVSEITKEFVDSKSMQNTARKVSRYAQTSPLEFVAETYAGLIDGRTFDNDVMALYKKYGGPAVS